MYWNPPEEVLIKICGFLSQVSLANGKPTHRPRRERARRGAPTVCASTAPHSNMQDIVLHELQASTSFSWSQILGEDLATHLFHDCRLALMNKAASNGYTATASRLLRTGLPPDSGNALHSAVSSGHLGVVVALLQERADVNLKKLSDRGRTPLHMAAQRAVEHADWQLHKALVDCDADPHAEDTLGKTPASLAQETSLSAAAVDGDTEAIQKLLILRCDPNATGSAWRTKSWSGTCKSPLWLSTQENHFDAVRILLAGRADVNAGQPLRRAVEDGHSEIVKLLLQAGANPSFDYVPGYRNEWRESIGESALPSSDSAIDAVEIAVRRGDAAVVQQFLDAGVVSSVMPLLKFALERNDKDVAALLLNARADPNGEVPIYFYNDMDIDCFLPGVPLNLVERNTGLMGLLLGAGADPGLTRRFHESAAQYEQYIFEQYG